MNLAQTHLPLIRLLSCLGHGFRRVLPKQSSESFGPHSYPGKRTIGKVYVINLNREPDRWAYVQKELRRIQDESGNNILKITERHAAVDARSFEQDPLEDRDVNPYYTLADQLFVEPQPRTLPTQFELEAPIRMSRAEVAVAKSHIEVWRQIAEGTREHVLILEDDVWFSPYFAHQLDQAWKEVTASSEPYGSVDILYASYVEAKNGSPKSFESNHVFRPVRGLWYLSGYILSRQGAERLLRLLPCRGPIDLWLNHQFDSLNVLATRRSIIHQRSDAASTNSYSILPSLSTIGAINSEGAALFSMRPTQLPVFAFGSANSGLSSLAMALSMLGYRCCSDLEDLPYSEFQDLRKGNSGRVFDAYVNVGCLEPLLDDLRRCYPQAKFVVTAHPGDPTNRNILPILASLDGADIIVLDCSNAHAWTHLCEHLRCVPPFCSFPKLGDLGQRHNIEKSEQPVLTYKRTTPKWDRSPWVVEQDHRDWLGIQIAPLLPEGMESWVDVDDGSSDLNSPRWSRRSGTFTGNLALFRPQNVELNGCEGATIHVHHEELGVRRYSAGALTSHTEYLFGKFEAFFRASDASGVVTGFFLHRNSPHQEIDIEITGNKPRRLIVNVFYNPGDEGDKFDYGYRGSPSYIELDFDASRGIHKYVIEWTPFELRWFVDDLLVHRRLLWDPTPIPHLPMTLHFNTWPSRSSQFAGRLDTRRLPTMTHVQSMRVWAYGPSALKNTATGREAPEGPASSGV